YGAELSLQEMFEKYKGVKLYDIIADVRRQHPLNAPVEEIEREYRQQVAHLFKAHLQHIPGARALLERICVPMCVVSNG
ncbi:hypothetical protein J8J22_23625, partial [Mycobacterium tuberculosis]|nr:hypothetical protein [Mycobacterium tuberculosis]